MKRLPQIIIAVSAWLIGLTVARSQISTVSVWSLVLASLGVLGVARLRTRFAYVLLAASFCVFGLWRGQLARAHMPDTVAGFIGHKVTVTGRVTSEPGWNGDRLHEFVIGEVHEGARAFDGTIKIKALSGHTREGEVVQVSGKVGRALGTSPAQVWYGDVRVIDYRQPHPVRLKGLLAAGLAQTLPSSQAGFIRGLIFGSRSALPTELEAALQRLGLTHIVAVSGFNLTVIVAALSIFGRRQTRAGFALTLASIGFFTVMAGASASIVRAAVMAILYLCVARARRRLEPRTALATSIFIMTAWDPSYLYRDLGWQLSVLALAGVLWLSPVFMSRRDEVQRSWRVILAATLGTYIARLR